ncbi:MAG: acylneuraminate cytidylyltransferase family protein, partial [Staphylococcus sp.]|nr:acylneuraminate cytidylyltransferase family protein [Staphylococcus sp.]
MKTVAFVPLKLNNERLPGKNTKQLSDGTPLVSLILSSLQKVSSIEEVYVYCSSESVIDLLPSGVKFLKRSEHLDLSTTKINEVLSAFANDAPADVYVLAHATAPFLTTESIQKGVNKVQSGDHDS